MKILKILFFSLCAVILFSCSTIKVVSDYDTKVDFSTYKTFAFYKKGIDKASVSDLDKKRIMRAIESQLVEKGFSKSETPDLLISIFTKSREQVNVTNNNLGYGFGWGYNPWFFGSNNLNINQYTEGTLFIDFIDKKEERINEFVNKIILAYPPKLKK